MKYRVSRCADSPKKISKKIWCCKKYPERYYVMKYALKINKEHISNLFKFGKKYLNSKIEKDVLDVLNQDILEQEIEVEENE